MLQPNQIFAGRYRVIRHIADGGMGAVYEAEHVSTEARVALKLLLPHVVQMESARRRFELEAKVAARVKSDHIVKVFDAGLDPETRSPYLAMELLIGHTLAAQINQQGALRPDAVLDLMRQVAHGLDAAHGYRAPNGGLQPIIHRDLKPENLFVGTRSDGSSLVKILDFGIAKVLSESTEVSQEMRGTPLYMAFEQAAGEAVSPQTDIWALGLITFFALTGRRYWPAANKPNGSTPALFAEILTLPLPLPSERARQEGMFVRLPPAFDTWMLTCIDRTPSRRFGSAGQAVAALERALRGLGHHPLTSGPGEARLRSRVTARYELLTASVAPGLSSASVPGVASEHRPVPQRPRGKPILVLGVGAASVCALALGLAWRWLNVGDVAQQRSAGVNDGPRERSSDAPAPAQQPEDPRALPSTPSASEANSGLNGRSEPGRLETEGAPARAPRVSVEREALRPMPPAPDAAAARPTSAPDTAHSARPSTDGRRAPATTARAGTTPGAGERRSGAAPASPKPEASAPASESARLPPAPTAKPETPSGEAPCEFFDPYAGRCMTVTPGDGRSPY